MVKEIEVKAHVKDFGDLKKKIIALGCEFSEPILQEDTVFLQNGITLENLKPGIIALRIRIQDGKTLFTFKQRQSVEQATIEREFEIADADQMMDVFKMLGFYQASVVRKKRIKAKYKEYEICLDDVEKLGKFIEVEKMSDGDDVAVQEELFAFLESLGINRDQREINAYDIQIMKLAAGTP